MQQSTLIRMPVWSWTALKNIAPVIRTGIVCRSNGILKQQFFCRNCSRASASLSATGKEESRPAEEARVRKRSVKDVANYGMEDDQVRIQGWIRSYRRLKENLFFDVSDGSSEHRVSVVASSAETPKGVNMHASVDITGVLQKSPKNPALLELHPSSPVKLVGACDQKAYPFGGKIRYTADHIRQYFHLRPKTNKFSSLLRLRSASTRAVSDYFTNNGFFQIHVPIFTSNDCEGAGEIFVVKPGSEELIKEMRKEGIEGDTPGEKSQLPDDHSVFFDKSAHLSVSGQLHLESAALGLDKVWTFSPVFRAENCKSTRHLSEFYMVEAELAFSYEIQQILEAMEGLVKFCIRRVLTDHIGDWNIQTQDAELRTILDKILTHPFTVMTFDEASQLLKNKASSIVQPGKGLSREQELILVEELNANIPVFVIDWPRDIKPFYMRECLHDPNKVSAVDLLVPRVGELCGGSLREDNANKLTSKIKVMDPSGKLEESLSWYIDLRRYGGAPSGGFGLGFDRLMQLITGISNIKDVCPFPRWPHHCPM